MTHSTRSMMTSVVAASVLLIAVPLAAQAPAATDAMAIVHQFIDAFNKGDLKTLSAACADQVSIIDEYPPYEWHGSGSCAKWSTDYDADAKKNGITDGSVTLGKPSHVDVSGDRAYIVAPANYTYKEKGKPVKEVGSILTVALQKSSAGWRITGWSWAKH